MKILCEVCNKNEAIGVYCVPGVPVSCAYCRECLANDNHSISILIANTACCSGLENTIDWWKHMVMHCLKYQGKTLEWFNEQVKLQIVEMDAICKAHDEMMEKG